MEQINNRRNKNPRNHKPIRSLLNIPKSIYGQTQDQNYKGDIILLTARTDIKEVEGVTKVMHKPLSYSMLRECLGSVDEGISV